MKIRSWHDLCVASNMQRLQIASAFLLTYVNVDEKTIEQKKIIMVCKLSEAGGMKPITLAVPETYSSGNMLHSFKIERQQRTQMPKKQGSRKFEKTLSIKT